MFTGRSALLIAFALGSLVGNGCSQAPNPPAESIVEGEIAEQLLAWSNYLDSFVQNVPPPTFQRTTDGVYFAKVPITMRDDSVMNLWIYHPDPNSRLPRPTVAIAPAGTMMIHGINLSEGDKAEHLPWVKAGFIVVAYELSGALASDSPSNAEFKEAITKFRDAKSGLLNAQIAIRYAQRHVRGCFVGRVYTVGHSSAGTHSLYVAQMDPSVKACVAFMPPTDIVEFQPSEFTQLLQDRDVIPNAKSYMNEISPINYVDRLSVPTLVVYSTGDQPELYSQADQLVNQMIEQDQNITSMKLPGKDHYDGMLTDGIPFAIVWLKAIDGTN